MASSLGGAGPGGGRGTSVARLCAAAGGEVLSVRRWAGLVAIAAQIHGGGLGQINPTLYAIGANPEGSITAQPSRARQP